MSKDYTWNGPLIEPSTNSFLWFVSFVFMFIVMVNVIFFLPSVLAMAFPQMNLDWMFPQ